MKKLKISFIIPTYNEADCIDRTLNRVLEYAKGLNREFEIIVSDDGSTDGTQKIVQEFINKNPTDNIILLQNIHKGKGFAVKSGMLKATGDYILFLDADLSTDITEFNKFLPYIENESDVIIGSRRAEGAKIVIHQPPLREFMGRVYTFLSNILLGTKYSDFTCGFKCFSKKAKDEIFNRQKIYNWSFDSEILYLAKKLGFKVYEVGIEWYNDPSTNVRLFRDTISSFVGLWRIAWYHSELKTKLALITIILIGSLLRFNIIHFGLPSKNYALTTYNPDEPITFWSIEKWQPKKLYFHPHGGFFWGGFHIYTVAGSLAVGKILRIVKFGNRDFYINNLNETDKLYLVGRSILIIFGMVSVILLYLITKEAYNDNFLGLLSALLLSILPAHVVNSIYIRPDILMMFFGLVAIFFSIKVIKTGHLKYYILSSFFAGVSAGTKYSGGIFLICPLIAHFLTCGGNNNSYFSNINILVTIKQKIFSYKIFILPAGFLLGFLISTPYVLVDFNSTSESFLAHIKHNLSMAYNSMNFDQYLLYGSGVLSYFKYYLKYAVGTLVSYASLIGMFLMFVNFFKTKNKFDLFFLLSGLVVLVIISSTKTQAVWYVFPFVPFCIIWFCRGWEILYKQEFKSIKILSVVILIIIFGYTSIYSLAYWNLYKQKNVREEASEWIEKNIPKGSKIAIARSYFWTPGILRQYNPPYEVLMGVDPIKSSVQEGVLGLKNLLDKTEYVVLTEYEFRWALHPKLQRYFPEHKKILDEIFNSRKFTKIAEFDKQAQFLFFKFKKNYPPGDWLIPNPKILVFKKLKM